MNYDISIFYLLHFDEFSIYTMCVACISESVSLIIIDGDGVLVYYMCSCNIDPFLPAHIPACCACYDEPVMNGSVWSLISPPNIPAVQVRWKGGLKHRGLN